MAADAGTGRMTRWSDEADAVIAGDLATALAYVTPARGVVVAPITTVGVRDRDAGTVTFTTSLAFGKKLARMRQEDRVALAFHAREHGFADGPAFVLVQGRATIGWTDPATQGAAIYQGVMRFFGAPRSGRFWTWWLREYNVMRVPVTVAVERVTTWSDPATGVAPEVHGTPAPGEPPASQSRPKGGVGPRVSAVAAAKRMRALPHELLGWVGTDGFPVVVPIGIGGADADGIELLDPTGAVPLGARRAGLVAHGFGPGLTRLRSCQYTGWLDVGDDGARYAPHTEQRYRTPRGKTATALKNGGEAKRNVRRARRAGTLEAM